MTGLRLTPFNRLTDVFVFIGFIQGLFKGTIRFRGFPGQKIDYQVIMWSYSGGIMHQP